MSAAKCTDDEFLALWKKLGSAQKVSDSLNLHIRNVYQRRKKIEAQRGIVLQAIGDQYYTHGNAILHTRLDDGIVIVGSDAHYWPGIVTTAHKAFVKFCQELKPQIVVLNGDVVDGSQNSRWPSVGWEKKPTVSEEIQAANDRLDEIQAAARGALLVWPAGNHDMRFETRLAQVAPEYRGTRGIHLKDHFSDKWHPCWRLDINDDITIKHRLSGGKHATYNNCKDSGCTVITGHLHSQKIYPYTFERLKKTVWGVDCGMLADPDGPQFIQYTEASTKIDWRSGFVVLTLRNGELLQPELVRVMGDGLVDFRGGVVEV